MGNEWRPKHTIPKDGTRVLGFAPELVDHHYGDTGMYVVWFAHGCWQGLPWGRHRVRLEAWQPLPAPPAIAKAEKRD